MSDVNRAYREILGNLDLLYDFFNVTFFGGELSPALITLEIEDMNRKHIKGYYQRKSPYGIGYIPVERINVNPNYFKSEDGWISIATTLLHEMIHQYARSKGIIDYKDGKHTIEFKRIAETHGMRVIDTPNSTKGYYIANLTDQSKKLISEFCKNFELPFITAVS